MKRQGMKLWNKILLTLVGIGLLGSCQQLPTEAGGPAASGMGESFFESSTPVSAESRTESPDPDNTEKQQESSVPAAFSESEQPASSAPDLQPESSEDSELPESQQTMAEPPQSGEPVELLPEALPLEFIFASGAGGWQTVLTLERDGSFTGMYSDSEMGETGDGYPNGTVYLSVFSGSFTDLAQLNDNTYRLSLSALTLEGDQQEWLEEGIRYLQTSPAGLESGDYLLHTKETPLEDLDGEFLSWWPGRYFAAEEMPDTLSCYGLEYPEMGYGFFAYEAE